MVVVHTLKSLFISVHLHLFLLIGLVPLAGRILGGIADTTGLRYSWYIKSTLPNFSYGLLHILLFCAPN